MALALRFAARSDVGLLREGNEDSAYAGPRLLVVADGMGGHAAGEVASSVVVATLAALDEDPPGPDLLDRLGEAVEQANTYLRDMVEGDPALGGMGTTLTALLRAGQRFALVHVGDSRCYLLRDGELAQLTHDHTFVQALVDEGRITHEQADHHPQRSLLTNALDGRGEVDVDLSIRETRAGDRWLLCSDGLSGMVSEETLRATLTKGDPDGAADALVELALRAGGPDNITCIVADVVEVDSTPSDIPQVVGAAASGPVRYRRRNGGTGASSAAARAAALTGPAQAADAAEEGHHPPSGDHEVLPRPGRWVRRLGLLVVVLALLAGAAAAAYAWSREQYFVGPEAEGVAIYRGLDQNVLGWSLFSRYEEHDVPLAGLTDYTRRRVLDTISAADLTDARRIVARLRDEAAACAVPPAAAATPTPRPTARPTARAAGTPAASPGSSPGTSPAPTPAPGLTPRTGARACPGAAP